VPNAAATNMLAPLNSPMHDMNSDSFHTVWTITSPSGPKNGAPNVSKSQIGCRSDGETSPHPEKSCGR